MTTPERLRARQRRESAFIALLAIALVVVVVMYRIREAADDRCFEAYIATQSETSKLRSQLVEQESLATRHIISGAFEIKTREEWEALHKQYVISLARIDRAREENPVPTFDADSC